MTLILLSALRFYRRVVSPSLGQHCRYYPSCAAYAVGAIETHGPWSGLGLSARRLLRCHPWCHGGINLVPPLAEARF